MFYDIRREQIFAVPSMLSKQSVYKSIRSSMVSYLLMQGSFLS